MIRRQRTPASVLNPFQRALSFVQDLGLGRRRRVSTKSASAHRIATPRGPGVNDVLPRLELERAECRKEIARLQAELERLHDQVTSGLSAEASPGSTRAQNLEELVEQSRRVRDAIHEKRLDLVRIERNIARERLLRGEARRPKTVPARTALPPGGTDGEDLAKRRAIGKALRECKLGDAPEHRALRRWAHGLLDPNPATRRLAVSKIAQAPHPALPLLQLATEDSDQRVRVAALNGLSLVKGRGAADCLRRFLRDPNESVRVAALRGLARLDERLPSIAELEAALQDPDPVVRKAAVELCPPRRAEASMAPALISALSFALYDQDVSVRVAAVLALGAAGETRGVAALIRAVGDSSTQVSEAAFEALCTIIPRAAEVAGAELPAADRSRVLKAWWREARVEDGSGTAESSALVAAAREVALELTRAEGRRAASSVEVPAAAPKPAAPAARVAEAPPPAEPARPAVPARAPAPPAAVSSAEPEEEPVADEFESILGEEDTSAESPSAPEGEGAADEKDDFESVFDEGAENGEDEEYEKVLGEDKA